MRETKIESRNSLHPSCIQFATVREVEKVEEALPVPLPIPLPLHCLFFRQVEEVEESACFFLPGPCVIIFRVPLWECQRHQFDLRQPSSASLSWYASP